jgi:hypothetical protein
MGPNLAAGGNAIDSAAPGFAAAARNGEDISARHWAWSCAGRRRNSAQPSALAFLDFPATVSGNRQARPRCPPGKTRLPDPHPAPSGENRPDRRRQLAPHRRTPDALLRCSLSMMNMASRRRWSSETSPEALLRARNHRTRSAASPRIAVSPTPHTRLPVDDHHPRRPALCWAFLLQPAEMLPT